MLRLLSWTACDKANSPEMRMFVPHSDSPGTSRADSPLPHSLKRKQSVDLHLQSDSKRSKVPEKATRPLTLTSTVATTPVLSLDLSTKSNPNEAYPSLPTPPDPKEAESGMASPTNNQVSSSRLDSVRNVIQTQMSLEILLKHKELRLIDQEIAKAQVALEQLRRCTEIPYPAVKPPSLNVSNGTGMSRRSSFPTPLPQSPAPWGVTDGPYARHYSKWLLPDPQFDGGEPELVATTPVTGKTPMKSRSMRASLAESAVSVSGSGRLQRSGKLKALPAGYGQPKEKATGPMILKRKSDGVQVKLVCPDCGRHDFGSAQGFINHCRIGHGRSFASHDAAAEACGEPVEFDESGTMIGVEPVVTPTTAGNVHPLIRSAKLLQAASPTISSSNGNPVKSTPSPTPKRASPDFKASQATPHLSDLVKNSGLGIDLQEMVSDAKTKIPFPDSESEDEDSDIEIPTQQTPKGRHPQVAGSKQLHRPAKSPMASPLLSNSAMRTASHLQQDAIPSEDGVRESLANQRPRHMALPLNQNTLPLPPPDPSPVSESNQAPSLVDDDEEYEPHSPDSSSVSDEHDMDEVEFQVQGDDDDARSVLPPTEFHSTNCAPSRPPGRVRRPSAIRRHGEDREEKHVSFVSPSPARDLGMTRQSGDGKRKKT